MSLRMQPAEEELARFFANSLGMLGIAGFDGRFKRLNTAWKSALGWTLEELEAKRLLEFVHPDDRVATRAEFKRLVHDGRTRTVSFENRFRAKDGSFRWLAWSANSLRTRRQIYVIVRDVTQRKHLEHEVLETSDHEKRRLGRE